MSRASGRCPLWIAVLVLGTAALAGCADGANSPVGPGGQVRLSKSSSTSVSVTATSPSYGNPGEVNETVTITGSGYKAGAQASWLLLSDSVDTTITVLSTQFISSTQLTSVISISQNSPIALRNVRVTNADRTQGVGNSMFEVTQAVAVSGATQFRGANDNGELTGAGSAGTIYWSLSSGLLQVGTDDAWGFSIGPMGNTIVANSFPRLYTRPGPVGTPWQLTLLPVDPAATGGGAWTLLTDSLSGQPLLIGGRELIGVSNHAYYQPNLWTWQAGSGSWQRIILPTGPGNLAGTVGRLSRDSVAAGWLFGRNTVPGTGTQAALWRPNGSGGWTLTTIGPIGSGAMAINTAGTLIVGQSGGVAAYWQQLAGGGWSAPITLPGGCSIATGLDDTGRIAVNGCLSSTGEPAGVLIPPYSALTMVHLGGLGPQNLGWIQSMSRSGNWIVGQAGNGIGVYWRPF